MKNLLKGASDFSASTTPKNTDVNDIIDWVSSQVDMQFMSAGYKIPFLVLSGETWAMSQTNYLTFVVVNGAAAYAAGHSLKPAPAVAPGREGSSGNIFQDMFDKELRKVWDGRSTRLPWRAQYYYGTKAEELLTQPSGPTTDFIEQRFDPMRFLSMWDMTEELRKVQNEIKDMDIDWDYLYNYKSFNIGLGNVD
ncbi:MAG: hypothetical protein A2W25_11910 [candidate division Zixibacteria bacterium RBG_16_53_22]|nr:MAG: hypothetical protein A2W25_11910 [candidate division Zixibacteria bacterium RBG_16_53_22]